MRIELISPSRKGRCFTIKLIRLFSVWGSNPRPSAHKTDALPTELTEMIPAVGFEPTKHYTTHLECAPFVRLGILVYRAPHEYLVFGYLLYHHILFCCVVNRRAQPSYIGIRTRVAPVKAEYPNQLDYIGVCH